MSYNKEVVQLIKFVKPKRENFDSYLAEVNGIEILIYTNVGDVLQMVLPKTNYCKIEKCKLTDEIPIIRLLHSNSLKNKYHVRKDTEKELKLKLHDERVEYPNKEIIFENEKIIFNEYPNNSILIEDTEKFCFTIIASSDEVLIFYLKKIIKQIIVKKIYDYSLHASAIVLDDKAVLFAGKGNTGKSTMAYNLMTYGADILNDDLIFVKNNEKNLKVYGANINPCIRECALSYLVKPTEFVNNQAKYRNPYHECYYLQNLELALDEYDLKAVFVLVRGNPNFMKPTLIIDETEKKFLLQQYIRSSPVQLDYISLDSVKVYKLSVEIPIRQLYTFIKDI